MNIGEDGEDYPADAFNFSASVFNFSLKEALQILQEHRQSRSILRPDAEIVLIVFYSVLITSGVVSNALLCFVVARQCSRRTMSNSGPTPHNLYIVNLAFAYLGLCLLVMPLTLCAPCAGVVSNALLCFVVARQCSRRTMSNSGPTPHNLYIVNLAFAYLGLCLLVMPLTLCAPCAGVVSNALLCFVVARQCSRRTMSNSGPTPHNLYIVNLAFAYIGLCLLVMPLTLCAPCAGVVSNALLCFVVARQCSRRTMSNSGPTPHNLYIVNLAFAYLGLCLLVMPLTLCAPCAGVVSNALLCFVVARQCSRRTMSNSGPTPQNLYIVNLAFAYLGLCLLVMPLTLCAPCAGVVSNALLCFVVVRQCSRRTMSNSGPTPHNLYIVNLAFAYLGLCLLVIPLTLCAPCAGVVSNALLCFVVARQCSRRTMSNSGPTPHNLYIVNLAFAYLGLCLLVMPLTLCAPCAGVVSNALLCFVVARQCSRRTMSNSGPTPRNLYIVNLAIADLGLCLLVIPLTLCAPCAGVVSNALLCFVVARQCSRRTMSNSGPTPHNLYIVNLAFAYLGLCLLVIPLTLCAPCAGVVSNALLCFVVARQCSRRTMSNSGPTPRNLYIVNLAFAYLGLCLLVMPLTLCAPCAGVVSNALLCFVVARQCSRRTMSNSGPTPRNLYIVNLAIADLGLCLLVMPFTLVALLRTEWTLGVFLCKMVPVAQGTNITVSAGTISAIALDRYYTIVRSPRGQVCQMATCSVAVTITLLWTFSVLAMVPLLLYQDVEVVRIGGLVMYEVCVERWPSPLLQCIYTLSLSVLQFLVPVLVLTIIHTKISAYLSVHLISPPGPRQSICKRAKREFRRNRRTMIILSCIAIVYALSWLPMTAFTVVMELNPRAITSPQTIYLVFSACHLVAMSSTVTNPLLYGWLNTNFRRELGSVLGREKKERTQRGQRLQYTSVHRPSVFVKDRRISFTFLTTLTTGTATTSHRGVSIHGPVSRVDHV